MAPAGDVQRGTCPNPATATHPQWWRSWHTSKTRVRREPQLTGAACLRKARTLTPLAPGSNDADKRGGRLSNTPHRCHPHGTRGTHRNGGVEVPPGPPWAHGCVPRPPDYRRSSKTRRRSRNMRPRTTSTDDKLVYSHSLYSCQMRSLTVKAFGAQLSVRAARFESSLGRRDWTAVVKRCREDGDRCTFCRSGTTRGRCGRPSRSSRGYARTRRALVHRWRSAWAVGWR